MLYLRDFEQFNNKKNLQILKNFSGYYINNFVKNKILNYFERRNL